MIMSAIAPMATMAPMSNRMVIGTFAVIGAAEWRQWNINCHVTVVPGAIVAINADYQSPVLP